MLLIPGLLKAIPQTGMITGKNGLVISGYGKL
jgi:hypothetical protein